MRNILLAAALVPLSSSALSQSLEETYASLCAGNAAGGETCEALRKAIVEKSRAQKLPNGAAPAVPAATSDLLRDITGTWLSGPDEHNWYSTLKITPDNAGGVQIWKGAPGLRGAGNDGGTLGATMWTWSIGAADGSGTRQSTYRSGKDFRGGQHRVEGNALRQTVPVRVYGDNYVMNLVVADRNTLRLTVGALGGASTAETFTRVGNIDGNAELQHAARQNSQSAGEVIAEIERKRSEGDGLGRILKGAVAGAAGMAAGASPETATQSMIAGAMAGGFLGAKGEDAGMIGSAAAAGSTRGSQEFAQSDADLREIASSALGRSTTASGTGAGASTVATGSDGRPTVGQGGTQQQTADFRGGYCWYQNDGAPLYVSQYGDVGGSGSAAHSRAIGTWQQYLADEHLLDVKRLQWFDGLPPRVPTCMAMQKDSAWSSAPTYVHFVPGN